MTLEADNNNNNACNNSKSPERRVENLISSVEETVRRQFQRRLAGHARQMLFTAQDFIAQYCVEDERGFYTEAVKRRMVRVNDAMRPWVKLLGKITTHKRFSELASMIVEGQVEGAVVYARVNMDNSDMYIGETENFGRRVTEHFIATCKHSHECSHRCKGCKEHVKYLKHRSARPSAWITVPTTVSQTHARNTMLSARNGS